MDTESTISIHVFIILVREPAAWLRSNTEEPRDEFVHRVVIETVSNHYAGSNGNNAIKEV